MVREIWRNCKRYTISKKTFLQQVLDFSNIPKDFTIYLLGDLISSTEGKNWYLNNIFSITNIHIILISESYHIFIFKLIKILKAKCKVERFVRELNITINIK